MAKAPAPPWQGLARWQVLQVGPDWPQHLAQAWQAWRQAPERPALLHWVCLAAQAPRAQDLQPAELARQCHGLLPGVHRLVLEGGALLLTLAIGPGLALLREQELEVDALILNGDEAEADPAAWAQALARCSRRGTRLSAPRASVALRAALAAAGFETSDDQPPWQAVFAPRWRPRKRWQRPAGFAAPARCTIVGAGLAGAACAASLARRNWQVTVLDRQGPAAGASGLPVGLMAPHVSPDDGPLSRLSRAGLRATLQQAAQHLLPGRDWAASGVLQRDVEPGGPRLPAHWPSEGQAWSRDAAEMDDLPPPLRSQAIWHASGAWIRPERLVAAWLGQSGIRLVCGLEAAQLARSDEGLWQVQDGRGQLLAESELLLLATGHRTQALIAPWLSGPGLQSVRGQLSWALHQGGERLPPVPVNGHGSLVPDFPAEGGRAWLLGATFDRDQEGQDLRPADHARTLAKLERLLPETAHSLAPRFAAGQVHGWAGVRCSWRDHLPVLGPLSNQWPGLWLCTALGSRGLSYSALCAELIAAWLHGEPLPLEPRLAHMLRASRMGPSG